MALDPILEAATNPWGGRRFYPPGSHPATARHRAQLAKLYELGLSDGHELVDYVKETLARFEEGESIAKQLYLVVSDASG